MNRIKKNIIPVITALIIVLALGFTPGCGGCFGCLGLMSCLGGSCIGAISNNDGDDIHVVPPATTPETEGSTEERRNAQSETESSAEPESESSADLPPSGYRTSTPSRYVPYDPEPFYAMCSELQELASGNDFVSIREKYYEILDEARHIDENSTALYVEYCVDPTDEYWSEQYTSDSTLETACFDAALTAVKAVTDGPCADKFRELVGETDFDEFNSYEPLTDEEKEIDDQITKLVDEYNTAIEQAEAEGTEDAELNSVVGKIFLELVSLRNRLAQIKGYDNFADYADELVYSRDFDSDEIAACHEAVKKIAPRVYDLLYNSGAYSAPYYMNFNSDTDELLRIIKTYAGQISPLAENAADILIDNRLYDIGSDSSRMEGAYTATFEESGFPFIFQTTRDSAADVVTLTHEFGHFTEATVNANPNPLIYGLGALELCEIHSNGLEALYSAYYDKIFGEEYAPAMRAYVVTDLLVNVTEGCLHDEFQRTVYANPDMTLDEVNKYYRSLCEEYGSPTSADDYWWMYVSHSFESPMYYFSYAASGLVALQIWTVSQSDYEEAVELWESIVDAGSYDYGYMELLEKLGISSFTNPTSVIMICDNALSFVERSVGYSGGSSNTPGIPDYNFPDDGNIEDWINDWLEEWMQQFEGYGR